MNKKELTLNIKELSHALGFDLVGISQAKKNIKASENFQKWLDMGYHGSMNWLTSRRDEKKDIFELEKIQCDALFFPSKEDMYPNGLKSQKEILDYRDILCDKFISFF